MRNTRWLRYGLATTIAAFAGLGLALTACSDDDATTTTTVDSGPDTDSSATDSSSDAADAAKPDAGTLAKLRLVNGATDLGPNMAVNARGDAAIRICFKSGTTEAKLSVAPYPPLPDKSAIPGAPAGIPYGTGGTFPSFGLDLEGRFIVPIIMNAKTLALKGIVNPGNGSPGTTCDDLVGATALTGDAGKGLVANQDYWELPVIKTGTFQKEKSFVLLLTGCVGDATIPNKDKCGPNPPTGTTPGVGNLAVKIFETNRTAVATDALGAQFLHASTQANALLGPTAGNFPIEPGFMANPTDGGTYKAASAAPVPVLTLSPAIGVKGVTSTDYFVASKNSPIAPDGGSGSGIPLRPLPLSLIQQLSGIPAPSIFADGKNFVFIAVGDVQQPVFSFVDGGGQGDGGDGSSFNTRTFHYLAFPTDP